MPNEYKLLSDGSWAMQVQIAGTSSDSSSSGALGVNVKAAEAIVPIDIQRHYAETNQTHNAAVVAATNGISDSAWIDADGFDKIAVTLKNDASTNSSVDVHWSHDGTNRIGFESVLAIANQSERAGIVDTKARYFKIRLNNTDAAPHTMNAYAYLKA